MISTITPTATIASAASAAARPPRRRRPALAGRIGLATVVRLTAAAADAAATRAARPRRRGVVAVEPLLERVHERARGRVARLGLLRHAAPQHLIDSGGQRPVAVTGARGVVLDVLPRLGCEVGCRERPAPGEQLERRDGERIEI